MSYAKQMLDSYSRTIKVDKGVLAATIDALNDCAQACTADVDADKSPDRVRLKDHEAAAAGVRGYLQELR